MGLGGGGWIDVWVCGCVDEWMGGLTDGGVWVGDGWMGGWVGGWMMVGWHTAQGFYMYGDIAQRHRI